MVDKAAESAGRDPSSLGIQGRVGLSRGVVAAAEGIGAWRAAGATHASVSTMDIGLGGVDGRIAALAEVARAIDLPPNQVSGAATRGPPPPRPRRTRQG